MLAGQYEGQARQDRLEAAQGLLRQADQRWAEIDKTADEELKRIVYVHGEEIKQAEARDQIHRRQLQARLVGRGCSMKWGRPIRPAGHRGGVLRSGSAGGSRVDESDGRLAGRR